MWPTPEPATNRVFHGETRPSRLVLPTVPVQGSAEPPKFRPSNASIARHSDRTDPPTWEVVHDVLTGRARVHLHEVADLRVNPTTVVRRDYSMTAEVDRSDPATASARGRHVSTITRPNGVIQGSSDVAVQATATHFHVTIDLELQVNGKPHHTRSWTESIPRVLL